MLDNLRFSALFQLQMMAIMHGVQLAVVAAADMQQVKRTSRRCSTRNANRRNLFSQTFSKVQKHFRLNWRWQGATLRRLRKLDIEQIVFAVAQRRLKRTVQIDQTHRFQRQRNCLQLSRIKFSDLRQHELLAEQVIQRRIFPVLAFARRQAFTHQLLPVLLSL